MRGLVFAVLVVAACEKADSRSHVEPCLADDIGWLRGLNARRECTPAATSECRAACAHGDADACFAVARDLEAADDRGPLATPEFETACRGGVALACTNWGARQFTVDHSVSTRCLARVFEKTCAAGETYGCLMVARVLVESGKTPWDRLDGFARLARMCDAGGAMPCNVLGFDIADGYFGPDPHALAPRLHALACATGLRDGCDDVRAQ